MIRLILLTDFTESFAYKLLKGILEYSKGREPWVVCRMPPSYKRAHGISGVLAWAKKWQADAIIAQFEPNESVELFRENGIMALAQDFKSRFTCIPNITSHYLLTGQMGADFFVQKGFRHFAYYGYKDVVWSEERFMGYKARVEKYGFKVHEYRKASLDNLWYYEFTPLENWIASLPRPVALMACDDTSANKILEVCRVMDIKVPEEISVLGVDNDEMTCNLSDPPLSSISLNVMKGGFEAARLIDSSLKNSEMNLEDVFIEPVMVINRLSTDIYATKNPAVLTALKYIHQNLSNKLVVDMIVDQVPLSRRLLEIQFKQITGKSIYQYIEDLRMERFAQKLLASNESVTNIGAEFGLFDIKNLSRQFKKWKGCTPLEYRRKNKTGPDKSVGII